MKLNEFEALMKVLGAYRALAWSEVWREYDVPDELRIDEYTPWSFVYIVRPVKGRWMKPGAWAYSEKNGWHRMKDPE